MFTDIVDSTRLKAAMSGLTSGRRDSAYISEVKDVHDQRLNGCVRRAGGRKIKSTGDGFLFTFSDPDEAVLCALDIQESLRAEQISTPLGPLQVRIGLHTGTAIETGGDYTAEAIDKAARVQQAAAPGEVCLSEETRVLVAGLRNVVFEEMPARDLKGLGTSALFKATRCPGLAQRSAEPLSPAELARLDNPYEFARVANQKTFKGRTAEMEELLDSIETGTHTAIFGLQRVGKTSLIRQGLLSELDARPALRDSIMIASVDVQRIGGAQVTYRDFVGALLEEVVNRLRALGLGREVHNLKNLTADLFSSDQYQRGDRSEFFSVFSRVLAALAQTSNRRLVFIIDEFSEIRRVIEKNQAVLNRNPTRITRLLPHEMYLDVPFVHHLGSVMKDDELTRKITFIVIVRPFMAEYDERQGLQLLKLMKPITLGRLDECAAKELITQPLDGSITFDDAAVDYLFDLTAGHPYLLQFILKLMVDKVRRNGRPKVGLKDIEWIKERMVTQGPEFDAQFAVLISDYSVDEVSLPPEALLGKGMLAVVAKLATERGGWAPSSLIFEEFERHGVPEGKTTSLISQLTRTRILDECDLDDELQYRLAVPLVQERFVRQNLYKKYFQQSQGRRSRPNR